MKKSYIKIRTQFEGFHCYPGAGEIDSRIKFLEDRHRHIFHVTVSISVTHFDRELEFFVCKWALNDFIKESEMNNKSCEMIANEILERHLFPKYGMDREYEVVVSEDNESDGIITWSPSYA